MRLITRINLTFLLQVYMLHVEFVTYLSDIRDDTITCSHHIR